MENLARIIGVGGLVVTIAAGLGARAGAAMNACDVTAEGAYRSCQTGARSDYWLAVGTCANISDAETMKACRKTAVGDLRDALDTCNTVDELRDTVCSRLGQGPYEPAINPANFTATIDNPFFPLKPGTTFIYEGQTSEGFEHDEFAVTHVTRVILGVTCVEVRDTRKLDGVLVEDTRDWFAQDLAGNVWYFGENTTLVDNGLPVDLSGTWTGGVDGAQPGIVMEAHPAIGDFYRQEFLLGEAEDLAEVSSLTDSVTVPYGSFTNCLKTTESAPIAPGDISPKYYAAGVGNLLTVEPNGDRSALVQIITE
jgi:hypothetical protein